MNHDRVSFNRWLPNFLHTKLISTLLLFSGVAVISVDLVFWFLNSNPWKPSFHHFGHILCKAQVSLFWLYPTSLRCHCIRHVQILLEMRCCFYLGDLAISAMCTSVASSEYWDQSSTNRDIEFTIVQKWLTKEQRERERRANIWERGAYSAKPSITSEDWCRASLPGWTYSSAWGLVAAHWGRKPPAPCPKL